jgi:formamidopyrimidine-DNA glycosylase
MPELPEVDAVVRRLFESAAGATIQSSHIERAGNVAPQRAEHFTVLHGATLLNVRRRAKYIFLDFSRGLHVQVHLRMTGNLYVLPDHRLRPHSARVWFRLADGRALIFDDPRTLGRVHLVTPEEIAALDAKLGPEPLTGSFTPETLKKILAAARAPIKPALLDQTRIAGIGNIYASEALFHARIHPATPANQVSARKVKPLHKAIQQVLTHAVASAYAEYTRPGAAIDSVSFGVAVYDREGEPCLKCRRPIERMIQSGRSTYYCPHCQPC